jgi:uncharacterized surface protein with fasciclin (FAS1) repeats
MLGDVTTTVPTANANASTLLLAAGLSAAGLGSTFNASLNATLFAPSDSALLAAASALGFSNPTQLLAIARQLVPVFQYHRK